MGYEIVAIGTSLGGLEAVHALLTGLPADFEPPIAIVMHRSVESGDALPRMLRSYTRMAVREPNDKETIRGRHVYIAPADYHLMVDLGRFVLSTDAPVSHARPSIDVLFEAVANEYGPRMISVVLTGANADGADGVRRVRQRGGYVIAEDPASAECPIMPLAAIAAGTDCVLPLSEIPAHLQNLVRGTGGGDDRVTPPRRAASIGP